MEFPFDLNYFIALFAYDNTFKQKIVDFNKYNKVDNYCPYIIHGDKLTEGFRLSETQKERLSLFPIDFKRESVLDIGCNNGYMLFELIDKHNAYNCFGIDLDLKVIILAIAKTIQEGKWNRKVQFSCISEINMLDSIKNGKTRRFDNIISFGVHNFRDNIEDNIFKDMIACANKRVVIEFANHPWDRKNKEEAFEYAKVFEQFGKVTTKILDYQGRLVMRVDKEESKEKRTPIILDL